jgi:hypothetical protein
MFIDGMVNLENTQNYNFNLCNILFLTCAIIYFQNGQMISGNGVHSPILQSVYHDHDDDEEKVD